MTMFSIYFYFPYYQLEGFQTWIGQVDVKSSPVYFYVRTSTDFNTTTTPSPFDRKILNVGGAMNLTTGKFTAPRDGIYSFSFTGLAYFPASSSRVLLIVYMYLNGYSIANGFADEDNTAGQYEPLSFQSTFNLVAGDEIWLEILTMSTGSYLTGSHYTLFSGYLLEEKIAVA